MKLVRQFLFETLILLILGYVLLFSSFLRSADFGSRLIIFSISFVILMAVALVRYSFGKELTIESLKLLRYFTSGSQKENSMSARLIIVTVASLFIFLLVSLIDVFVYVLQTGKDPVAFGFPVIIYSFVQSRFLIEGVIFNLALFASILYFLLKIILKK